MNELIRLLDVFPDKPWDWYDVSSNPNITLKFIDSHSDKDWNWFKISRNPSMTLDIINNNPNITLEFIKDNLDKSWDWVAISINKFSKDPTLIKREINHKRDKKIKCWRIIILNIVSI
jgi:hypothetical protein